MSGFDVVIGVIFLISVIVSVMRGFIKEALSITSWVLAIWLAFTFDVQAGDFISQYWNIPNATFRAWTGFAAIFIITLFVFSFVSFIIAKLLLHKPIKGTDRVLGIGFGAARAALIVSAIVVVVRGFGFDNSQWWTNSTLLPRFLPIANFIESTMSNDLKLSEQSGAILDRAISDQLEKLQTTPGNEG